jgi:hypothetical protein
LDKRTYLLIEVVHVRAGVASFPRARNFDKKVHSFIKDKDLAAEPRRQRSWSSVLEQFEVKFRGNLLLENLYHATIQHACMYGTARWPIMKLAGG